MAEKILIAEDEKETTELLKILLESKKYEIFSGRDGQETLAQTKRLKPDLILMDVLMPKLNGFEVLHLIKEDPELQNIPVIFLTAKGRSEDKIAGLKMGVQDYITKPFDIYEMMARIDTALRMHKPYGPFRRADRRMHEMALTHPLTGLYAHPLFAERVEEELARAKKRDYPLGLLLIGLAQEQEFIKKYSKTQFQLAVQRLAHIIRQQARVSDVPGQMPQDQLVLLLPQTDLGGTKAVAERILQWAAKSSLVQVEPDLRLPLALGGIVFHCAAKNYDLEELYRAGLGALEQSRAHAGREIILTHFG
jgi:diguanylate cyclase (GGDEF)-like protein